MRTEHFYRYLCSLWPLMPCGFYLTAGSGMSALCITASSDKDSRLIVFAALMQENDREDN
ncbi:hypothetical protein [Paenibacillus macquariensis]|uniref:hypothetical protein n=1 Tax=Paenibacillus macquariensis TaxID=948756 RepID=UPI0011158863|nr:hypothetical protein [Paenibacillus macquariensis]MEC0093866.1 hypothetical protein [Paenibacillus macquariensis]